MGVLRKCEQLKEGQREKAATGHTAPREIAAEDEVRER